MRDRFFLGRSFLTPNLKKAIAIVWGVHTNQDDMIRNLKWINPTYPKCEVD